MKAHYHDRDTTCLKCPVACGKQYAIGEGEFAGTRAKMPEYETIFALGPMLGIANPEALILANDLCDLLGMDTISIGVTLAFVCEALERGWLKREDVGVPFGWGDWRGMLRLVEMTGAREGFGARIAEGAWRLAESVHPEGTRLVYGVKRLELPAHWARALKGMSIGYATATRGGSHHDTRPTPQYAAGFDRRSTVDKPAFAIRSQHFTAVGDSLVMCRFTSERGFGLYVGEPYAAMIRAVTGWDVTVDEVERVGERIVNLARLLRDWYPSSSATNSDAEPSGDAGLTRLGHAFAATCFALIAVIGVIGLVQQGRAVRQAQAEQDGVATKIAEVREEVLGLDKRVASVESRVEGGAESADRLAHRLDDRVAGLETRMTNTQTALRQMSGDVARVQANVKQIERVVAAEAPRSAAARGLTEPPHAAAP